MIHHPPAITYVDGTPQPRPRPEPLPPVRDDRTIAQAGQPIRFAVHRLAAKEAEGAPCWPSLATVTARRDAASTRYIRGAQPVAGFRCRWPAADGREDHG